MGRVQADVDYDCSQEAPLDALLTAGFSVGASVKLAPLCAVEGWVSPLELAQIASAPGVTRIAVPSYVVPKLPRPDFLRPKAIESVRNSPQLAVQSEAASSSSAIDHNGVLIMRADQFVALGGSGGAGVTVGVQSTGVASLSVIQGRHELPGVTVVNPSGAMNSPLADEGTALLEEVHAVAPGAGLAYCGPDTFVEYASCLGQLIKAGATVLVDDVVFTEQDLLSSDSTDVQAIEQLLTQYPSVALFTAAGNYNGSYWEGSYSPVSLASQKLAPLTCPLSGGGQTDSYVGSFDGSPSQALTVSQTTTVPITFAWADPPGKNASKFDVYWISSTANASSGCFSGAAGTNTQISEQVVLSAGSYTLYVATPDVSGAGKFLKLWIGGDGLTSISEPTPGSIVTPQAFAAGAVTVGAVNGSDGVGNGIETFSSVGPITVEYPTAAQIQAPVLVAPDGINVDASGTYFAAYLFPDGNFYGTSASVPNAGAVATLLRGAFPSLTVPQLVSALQKGALQLGSGTPNATFGYGRIDAMGALGTFPGPAITSLPDSSLAAGSNSAAFPFTVSGTGNLHFTVTSSNAALIPASIVPSGSPGVTISPAGCGKSTLSCTVAVTSATGQSSTVKVTIGAADGANRTASASMNITVAGTPGSTASPAPGGSNSGGGGALGWWELSLLGAMLGLRVFELRRWPGSRLCAPARYCNAGH